MFISETKCGEEVTDKIKNQCQFDGCLTIKSVGTKGGICLFWKGKDSVSIRSFSQNHIDSQVEWAGKKWQFTGVYGFPETNKKDQTWQLIRNLQNSSRQPWLLGGDFNEILDLNEKLGGPVRERKPIEEFRKLLDDCELRDIKPRGEVFTWHGTGRGNHVWEKLDRFLCNPEFDELFNYVEALNLDWLFSDHRPIEIRLDDQRTKAGRRKGRNFKFEEIWTRHKECKELISRAGNWSGNNILSSSLDSDLLNCSRDLNGWGKSLNINRKNKIRECKENLKIAFDNIHNIDFNHIHAIEFELDKLVEEEEIYWKQRS